MKFNASASGVLLNGVFELKGINCDNNSSVNYCFVTFFIDSCLRTIKDDDDEFET